MLMGFKVVLLHLGFK